MTQMVYLLMSWCITLFIINHHVTDAETKADYQAKRQAIIDREKLTKTGGALELNSDEEKVNAQLMKFKDEEFEIASQPNGRFPPAEHFFKARSLIEESNVFRIIKQMPKGAALHTHDMAVGDVETLIKTATYDPNCYLCINSNGQLLFRYFQQPPLKQGSVFSFSDCLWISVNEARNMSGNPQHFDSLLYNNLTMLVDDPAEAYATQDIVWAKFGSIFVAKMGLVFYDGNFKRYYYESLRSMYDDNVQYTEMRGLLPNVYELNGTEHDTLWTVSAYKEITEEFTRAHPDFLGAKIIYTSSRSLGKSKIQSAIQTAIKLRHVFPDFIAGYDLVAHEDAGHPLLYFLDDLLLPSLHGINLPYFFHAGETDWYGVSTDINIIDALLLNTTRIGHGFAIIKHPEAMKMAREQGVALEVNPISNQVLKYVADLRNHPASSLMAEDFPMVISSDDPSLWGIKGLSYDFYEAFMGLGGKWADLRTLKKLALNSIKYSAMSDKEKNSAYELWNTKWNMFIAEIISLYKL